MFYTQTKMLYDASTRGTMMGKDVARAISIIESLDTSDNQVQCGRSKLMG